MPRTRSRKPNPDANALIASAARMAGAKLALPKGNGSVQEWQQQAWYFYDTVGEFRYACDWKAQAISRAELTITEDTPEGEVVITEGPEVEALQILGGGTAGQSQLLHMIALHLDVPGETFLVGEVVENDLGEEVDEWVIYSNEELTPKGKPQNIDGEKVQRWELDRGDGQKRLLASDSVVIRIWASHPRKWVEADSPARAVLPVLREVEQLTKHVAASIDSRLAGAGMLLLPSEMTFSSPTSTEPGNVGDEDPFLAELTEAMVTPITDRSNASAVVPIVVRAPGALLGNAKHITFATPLDDKALALRTEGIRRLALGMDLPPEVLLGLSDSNHWSAWQIDESALKVHIEPRLELIAAALTDRWLRPAVEALGGVVNPRRRINFDTSELRLRPDRSSQALELHSRHVIDDDAVLRETGFDEGDKPDDAALKLMLLRKIAGGMTTADLTAAALALLGVQLTPKASEVEQTGDGDQAPPGDGSTGGDEPVENRRDLPADEGPEAAAASAVLAAAELLVGRAVERANNRLNRRGKTRRPVEPEQLDSALHDAWTAAPRTAALLGVDPEWFTAALDTYSRAVLAQGCDHQPAVLAKVLAADTVLALTKGRTRA